MFILTDDMKKLLHEVYEKVPRDQVKGLNHDEWKSIEEYEEYLKGLLVKDKEF